MERRPSQHTQLQYPTPVADRTVSAPSRVYSATAEDVSDHFPGMEAAVQTASPVALNTGGPLLRPLGLYLCVRMAV